MQPRDVWPCNSAERRPWAQTQRGGTREDRTLRSVTVSLPPYIANIDVAIDADIAVELEAAMSEISRLDSTHGTHLAALNTLLLRTESVASSKIERVEASLDDYARALHGGRGNSSAVSMVAATTALNEMIASVDRNALREEEPHDRTAWMTLFSMGLFRRYGRVTDQQHRGFLDFLGSKGWWQTICEVHPDVGAEAWMDILRAYGEEQQTDTLFELWMDSFPRLYRIARWLDTYVHLFQTLDRRDSKLAKFLLSPASDPSLSGSGIEAPTLSGMLRLGQHLVIRELLRIEVLSSDVARELAFAPRSAVLELMARLGHTDLRSSSDIYRVLVSELGEEAACFSGAYDIPLQLIATNEAARREAERWAEQGSFVDTDETAEQEEQL